MRGTRRRSLSIPIGFPVAPVQGSVPVGLCLQVGELDSAGTPAREAAEVAGPSGIHWGAVPLEKSRRRLGGEMEGQGCSCWQGERAACYGMNERIYEDLFLAEPFFLIRAGPAMAMVLTRSLRVHSLSLPASLDPLLVNY
jgi:hypothetical protein